jgi:UDP-N-acetyl-D-glucosamine dehydrogenase
LAGARVGVIGVAFKPNVRDTRNSPAAEIVARLAAAGAEVAYHDPLVQRFVAADRVERRSHDLAALLAASDVVLVLVRHAAVDWPALYAAARLVVDTVNSSAGAGGQARVLRLGAGWRG